MLPQGGVSFRVWAPRRRTVAALFQSGSAIDLTPEAEGYFSGIAPHASPGDRYRFQLDGGAAFPDPASRFQPEGPHGPSQIVDPGRFSWTDTAWPGAELRGQVIYEMHLGTFTREGTLEAARREMEELARIGITAIELMPVADFPGRFGWGYDGVGWFAPAAIYGQPDDLRQFVDDAHRHGIAVVLDVVYNHFGPDGNYIRQYSEAWFTDRYGNEWGEAINFDGPDSGPVREFACANAGYWAEEYHIDGLRLDATHQIFDSSPESILTALGRAFRERSRGLKSFVVAENDLQPAALALPTAQGGCELDGLWSDDFHHSARVAATGRNEAYYRGYRGTAQELLSAIKFGFLYQGQRDSGQSRHRGTPAWDLRPWQFVICLQNHDQISNSAAGLRLHALTSPGCYRALTALLLLAPQTPMLFQGQEFAASQPFLYFADHHEELAALVKQGRAGFLGQFPSIAHPEMLPHLADPAALATFERCKLDFGERNSHAPIYRLHQDLIRLRRDDPVFRAQTPRGVDGAVLGPGAFVLRFFGSQSEDRLLLLNLATDLPLEPSPEPLLAPPCGRRWTQVWNSEDPAYGGAGSAPLRPDATWTIAGHSAVVLAAREQPPVILKK